MEQRISINRAAIVRVVILPIGIYMFFSLLALFTRGKTSYVLQIIMLLLLLHEVFTTTLPVLAQRITANESSITFYFQKNSFEINWKDIKFTELEKDDNSISLNIATDSDFWQIPIKYFNYEIVWELMKTNVDPSALEAEAYKTSESYSKWKEELSELSVQQDDFIEIQDSIVIKLVGWVSLVLMAALTIYCLSINEIFAGLVFMVFALLGLFLVFYVGKTYMNRHVIRRSNKFGKYEIKWDEVKLIELSNSGDTIIFAGENKQLAIPGPAYWAGEQEESFGNLFIAKIEELDLQTKKSLRASFKFNKNCKVKDSK